MNSHLINGAGYPNPQDFPKWNHTYDINSEKCLVNLKLPALSEAWVKRTGMGRPELGRTGHLLDRVDTKKRVENRTNDAVAFEHDSHTKFYSLEEIRFHGSSYIPSSKS